MLEKLHLDELTGSTLSEVLGKLFAKIPGWDTILPTLEKYSVPLLIFGIILALLQCLFGYKMKKYWTCIDGLMVFGVTGGIIAHQEGLGIGLVIAITAGAGLIGGLSGYFLWLAGCFFRVFFFVSIIVFSICTACELAVLGMIIGLAAGLIAGILAAAFNKPFMIIYTSIAGAFTAAGFLTTLVPELTRMWFLPVVIGGACSILGIIIQAVTNMEKHGSAEAVTREDITEAPAAEPAENELAQTAVMDENAAGAEFAENCGADNIIEAESAENIREVSTAAKEAALTESAEQAGPEIEPVTEETITGENAEYSGKPEPQEPEKSLCPNCGTEYTAGAKFCIRCGQKRQLHQDSSRQNI